MLNEKMSICLRSLLSYWGIKVLSNRCAYCKTPRGLPRIVYLLLVMHLFYQFCLYICPILALLSVVLSVNFDGSSFDCVLARCSSEKKNFVKSYVTWVMLFLFMTRFIRLWNSPQGGSFDFRCLCKNLIRIQLTAINLSWLVYFASATKDELRRKTDAI